MPSLSVRILLSSHFQRFLPTLDVYSVIEPYITPIIKDVTATLSQGSRAVLDGDHAQYEVFDDPHASDPSHSMLSKDHFDNILNEPAGKVAKVVVEHTVRLVVEAWSDPYKDINATLNEVRRIRDNRRKCAESTFR